MDSLIGQVIGRRYEVLRLIGQGGMGSVYEIRNLSIGRSFALKTLSAEAAQNIEAITRFRQEASVIAGLRHPHIVELVDWDTLPDGTPAMVMEYMQGENLAERLQRGPLPWSDIARFGDQLLSALAVAHRAGITHRDLKPANVFIIRDEGAEERIKLLDFGVSKLERMNADVTAHGMLVGTPPYMSPEQANGDRERIGPQTDVWATGAILYEMVTSKRAFEGKTLAVVLRKIVHDRPTHMRALRPDTPQEMVDLIDRVLANDDTRIRTAQELRTQLAAALKPTLRALTGQAELPPAPVSSAAAEVTRPTAMHLAPKAAPSPPQPTPAARAPFPDASTLPTAVLELQSSSLLVSDPSLASPLSSAPLPPIATRPGGSLPQLATPRPPLPLNRIGAGLAAIVALITIVLLARSPAPPQEVTSVQEYRPTPTPVTTPLPIEAGADVPRTRAVEVVRPTPPSAPLLRSHDREQRPPRRPVQAARTAVHKSAPPAPPAPPQPKPAPKKSSAPPMLDP